MDRSLDEWKDEEKGVTTIIRAFSEATSLSSLSHRAQKDYSPPLNRGGERKSRRRKNTWECNTERVGDSRKVKERQVQRSSASASNVHNRFQKQNTCDDEEPTGHTLTFSLSSYSTLCEGLEMEFFGNTFKLYDKSTPQTATSWERPLQVMGREDGCLAAPHLHTRAHSGERGPRPL